MSQSLIALIVIIIAIIIAVIILVVVLRYKGSSPTPCTASGQCSGNSFCSASGYCAPGTGANMGQSCTSDSSCVVGLFCSLGTCQAPLTDLVITPSPVVAGTAATSGSLTSSNSSSNSSNNSTSNSTNSSTNSSTTNNNKFLLTSSGNIITVQDTPLYLTDAIPDEKVTELKNYISNVIRPSYISTVNSFKGQFIYLNTDIGKYYLHITPEGSYWVSSKYINSASNVKFSYDKSTNFLSVGSKQVYVATNGQSTQIKFSTNKSYLRTTSTTNNSKVYIERSSSGYYIRSTNGLYLTMDTTSASVSYAKYPAILTSFAQLNSQVELSYLNLSSKA